MFFKWFLIVVFNDSNYGFLRLIQMISAMHRWWLKLVHVSANKGSRLQSGAGRYLEKSSIGDCCNGTVPLEQQSCSATNGVPCRPRHLETGREMRTLAYLWTSKSGGLRKYQTMTLECSFSAVSKSILYDSSTVERTPCIEILILAGLIFLRSTRYAHFCTVPKSNSFAKKRTSIRQNVDRQHVSTWLHLAIFG